MVFAFDDVDVRGCWRCAVTYFVKLILCVEFRKGLSGFPFCLAKNVVYLSQVSDYPMSVVQLWTESRALPGGQLFRLQFTASCINPPTVPGWRLPRLINKLMSPKLNL